MLCYTFWNEFMTFIIWWALWWIWSSFLSWAEEALLYETLVQLKRENEYKRISWDVFFYWRMSSVFAWVAWWFLAAQELVYTFYASLIPFIPCFFLYFTLKETRHFEKQGLETWNHFKMIFKESFLHNPKIRTFIIFTWIAWFFVIDFWFKQRYLEFLDIPILYFWIILWIVPVFSGLWWKYAEKIEKMLWFRYSLLIIPFFPFLIWFLMWVSKTLLIIPLMIIVNLFWWFSVPIFNDFIQKQVSSDRRATIMSLMSLSRRLIFFIFAPMLWWITDVYDIQTTFLILALLVFLFVSFNVYFLRRVKVI